MNLGNLGEKRENRPTDFETTPASETITDKRKDRQKRKRETRTDLNTSGGHVQL